MSSQNIARLETWDSISKAPPTRQPQVLFLSSLSNSQIDHSGIFIEHPKKTNFISNSFLTPRERPLYKTTDFFTENTLQSQRNTLENSKILTNPQNPLLSQLSPSKDQSIQFQSKESSQQQHNNLLSINLSGIKHTVSVNNLHQGENGVVRGRYTCSPNDEYLNQSRVSVQRPTFTTNPLHNPTTPTSIIQNIQQKLKLDLNPIKQQYGSRLQENKQISNNITFKPQKEQHRIAQNLNQANSNDQYVFTKSGFIIPRDKKVLPNGYFGERVHGKLIQIGECVSPPKMAAAVCTNVENNVFTQRLLKAALAHELNKPVEQALLQQSKDHFSKPETSRAVAHTRSNGVNVRYKSMDQTCFNSSLTRQTRQEDSLKEEDHDLESRCQFSKYKTSHFEDFNNLSSPRHRRTATSTAVASQLTIRSPSNELVLS